MLRCINSMKMPHPIVTGIISNNHEKFDSALTDQQERSENIKYIMI